ncbi:hypothetical protein E4191_22905 (plasmid) [Paracoccus liaowanqingii]|uniref:Uncharacterized protein n=1 Tax=Paracoccus liaowanqingii TaxID=2560053 RepID=A0A4Y5STP7_9RHOB|nr:hypothetical protein [Paracoccus liaowanqingii]QDA36901.1 hypothetical protein E4191_22905 [Paracoccus liaowanqingii]
MPAALTISTQNESGAVVIIDCLSNDEVAKSSAADDAETVGDQEVRYRVSDTGQAVTRIDLGKYRIDETGETLIET